MPKKTPKGKGKAAAATPKSTRKASDRSSPFSTAATRRGARGMLQTESAELKAADEAASNEVAGVRAAAGGEEMLALTAASVLTPQQRTSPTFGGVTALENKWTDKDKQKLVHDFEELGPTLPGWAGSATNKRFVMIVGHPEAHLERKTTAKAARKIYDDLRAKYSHAKATQSKSGGPRVVGGRGQLSEWLFRCLDGYWKHVPHIVVREADIAGASGGMDIPPSGQAAPMKYSTGTAPLCPTGGRASTSGKSGASSRRSSSSSNSFIGLLDSEGDEEDDENNDVVDGQ
jgi:hypothetical protein